MMNLIAGWNALMPSTFDYGHLNPSQQQIITNSINSFYFGNETLPESLDAVKLTEVLFLSGFHSFSFKIFP